MEISKGLQQEIQLVQGKLQNAIRDHQVCVEKLKDDPTNAEILGRIKEIEVHILSLGRCQKQALQRLRKELESIKAENPVESKVSFASLLGFNNNNHITANNETTTHVVTKCKIETNGLDNPRLATVKVENEPIVRNGNVLKSHGRNARHKRAVTVETVSVEDESDVVNVMKVDDKTRVKIRDSFVANLSDQIDFMEGLGLITNSKFVDLQNKRTERKRRTTANPQFVYSNWEIPTKRKRHNYLQSACNVPQTRQTTARLNEPSPPTIINKPAPILPPPKSTTPPARTITKSIIPTQKATTRPNILRNMSESRVFVNKGRVENGNGPIPLTSTKTSQPTNHKTVVHIPGLPSGLTIERIEHDSAVCINCRNPGTLTSCNNCQANYHVSCHSISPPPPRLCPKCAQRMKDEISTTKIIKNEEIAAASYAPGVVGKAGEDPEINKASCGLYKIGTAAKQSKQQMHGGGRGSVNQLPSSTFLIPISTNALAATSSGDYTQSDSLITDTNLDIVTSTCNNVNGNNDNGNVSYDTSIVLNNQFSRSSVTYVPQPESKFPNVAYAYRLPTSDQYLIVKKIPDPHTQRNAPQVKTLPIDNNQQESAKSHGREVSGIVESRQVWTSSQQLDKLTGRLAASIALGKKKSTTRAIPGLKRIILTDNKSISLASDNPNNDDMDELSIVPFYDGNPKQFGEAFGPDSIQSIIVERSDTYGKCTMRVNDEQSQKEQKSDKYQSNSDVHDALLASDNKSNNVADCTDKSWKGTSRCCRDGNNRPERESIRSESASEQSLHSSNVTGTTEYVKLEEAHLSAPLGAKLISKVDDLSEKVKRNPRFTSIRRRTTEDRTISPPLLKAYLENSNDSVTNKEQFRTTPIILKSKSLDDSVGLMNFEIPLGDEKFSKTGSETSSADEGSSTTSMADLLFERTETIGSHKADIESKDFDERNVGEISHIDAENSDMLVADDDDDKEDSPIVDDDINENVDERLSMSTVSPEIFQVLEQFESAMMKDSSDKTANI